MSNQNYSAYKGCPAPPPRHPVGGRAGGSRLEPTPADIEGPFYKPDAPWRTDVIDGADEEPLRLAGFVRSTHGTLLVAARLDFWQADGEGVYDNDGWKHRCRLLSHADGGYTLLTFVPGDYEISDPGAPQPHEFRCAHLHVKVTAPGFKPLTTQLYFPDDEFNATDRWFDARRVIARRDAAFDFVLEPTA